MAPTANMSSWSPDIPAARFMAMSAPRYRIETARAPQENHHHQHDVGSERQLRCEKARVVGGECDEQRADEVAAHRAEPADDHHDEDQDLDLEPDAGRE